MSRPRVAVITNYARAERVSVYDEMARRDELDFRVFYLQRLAPGRYWKDGPPPAHDAVQVPEIRLNANVYFNPGLLARYVAYRPDLMVMTQYSSPGMQAAMYLTTALRRPWVFWGEIPHVRYADMPLTRNERLRGAARALATLPVSRWPREIWAIGTRAVDAYRELSGGRVPVLNLPYFSDLDRFFAAGDARPAGERLRFVFCGSLSLRKGADAVAEAIQRLHDEGHDFSVEVAGRGPLADRFEALARGARDRVTLHGFLQREDIPPLYGRSDVLLFPSRHDGWGMTLPEGMASGCAVVSTVFTGSAVDMIRDGESGLLLEEVTADTVAGAMRRLLADPALAPRLGAAGREVATGYTHRVGARRFLDAMHRALGRRAPG